MWKMTTMQRLPIWKEDTLNFSLVVCEVTAFAWDTPPSDHHVVPPHSEGLGSVPPAERPSLTTLAVVACLLPCNLSPSTPLFCFIFLLETITVRNYSFIVFHIYCSLPPTPLWIRDLLLFVTLALRIMPMVNAQRIFVEWMEHRLYTFNK